MTGSAVERAYALSKNLFKVGILQSSPIMFVMKLGLSLLSLTLVF